MADPPEQQRARQPARAERLAAVDAAFASLPARYLGAPRGFDATWHVRLHDLGRTWEVRATEGVCLVRNAVTSLKPDVVISTDAATWLALRHGELSGVDAFHDHRLAARGSVDLALRFEALFRLPSGRAPLIRLRDVAIPGRTISTLTMGDGPDVLLIHGLGAAKSSFLLTASTLTHAGYRVHAIDLPGFGASSKPLLAPYNARWFADGVLALMDELGIERAHLVGNSMGGRVSIEVALRAPERVKALALLCPAVAFVKRDFHPLVSVLRPELGVLPHRIHPALISSQLQSMFADPDALDPAMHDVVVDEFSRIYASAGARLAFLSAARNIYLDRPFGRHGFYARLSELVPPAVFVWGTRDPLIPAGFRRHVEQWLPSAQHRVLEGCGHVPQIERSDEVEALLTRFFGDVEARSPARARRGLRRAA